MTFKELKVGGRFKWIQEAPGAAAVRVGICRKEDADHYSDHLGARRKVPKRQLEAVNVFPVDENGLTEAARAQADRCNPDEGDTDPDGGDEKLHFGGVWEPEAALKTSVFAKNVPAKERAVYLVGLLELAKLRAASLTGEIVNGMNNVPNELAEMDSLLHDATEEFAALYGKAEQEGHLDEGR